MLLHSHHIMSDITPFLGCGFRAQKRELRNLGAPPNPPLSHTRACFYLWYRSARWKIPGRIWKTLNSTVTPNLLSQNVHLDLRLCSDIHAKLWSSGQEQSPASQSLPDTVNINKQEVEGLAKRDLRAMLSANCFKKTVRDSVSRGLKQLINPPPEEASQSLGRNWASAISHDLQTVLRKFNAA